MPGTGARVSEGVCRPRNKAGAREVAVVALVKGLEAQEGGRRPSGGGGAPAAPANGGSVVGQGVGGALTDIGRLGEDVAMGDGGRQLQIAIGDRPEGLTEGNEGVRDGRWKPVAPKEGEHPAGRGGNKMDPTHAHPRRIACPKGMGRVSRDELGNAGGAGGYTVGQPLPVLEGLVDGRGELQAVGRGVPVSECVLEGAEKPTAARQGKGHGAQFAKELVPRLDGNTALGREDGKEDVVEALHAVGGQRDGGCNGVDVPAQDSLASGPGGIPFEHLLEGGRLLAMGVVPRLEGPEHIVEGMEQNTFNAAAGARRPLGETNEVINIDIPVIREPCHQIHK